MRAGNSVSPDELSFPWISLFGVMALLGAKVAKAGFLLLFHCGVPHPWALCVSALFLRHMLALPLTHASSSGTTLAASVHRTSQLHSGIRGGLTFGSPSPSSVVHDRLMHLFQETLQSHSLVFRTPRDLPAHRCGTALDMIISTPSLPGCVTVHSGFLSDHMLCSCHLDIPQARTSLRPCARLACHHSLSAWHQSVLALVSGPLPDFPARASTLDSLFDSLTRIPL